MKIIEWLQFIEDTKLHIEGTSLLGNKPSAITIGVFDGVHRGHRLLIENVISQKNYAEPVVITFLHAHHKKKSGNNPGDILSFRQKMALIENFGIQLTIVIEFSESFRHMPGKEFLKILHEHTNMSYMSVGSDFRCGYKLDTDAPMIEILNARWNIHTDIVEQLKEGSKIISSSLIRDCILKGKLNEAVLMLGRPFIVDLDSSLVSKGAGFSGRRYDIAGKGCVLPPPGKYQVFLHEPQSSAKSGFPALDENKKNRSEILVEDGMIYISEDVPEGKEPEYVEFII